MIDFSTCKPEEVLRPDFLNSYKEGMAFFHLQLSRLNIDLFIVERILDFPIGLFLAPPENIFLVQVVHNAFQVATLQITKIATDQGGDTVTLPKIKNSVLGAATDRYRDDFREHLRRSKFSQRTRQMLEKARRLRDTRIAHFIRDSGVTMGEEDRMTLDDLRSLRDELNQQLDVLSFNTDYFTLPISYHPAVIHPAGSDPRSDIEKFLDGIALQSNLIHMPERRPERWRAFRDTRPMQQIDQINRFRERFGLPRA